VPLRARRHPVGGRRPERFRKGAPHPNWGAPHPHLQPRIRRAGRYDTPDAATGRVLHSASGPSSQRLCQRVGASAKGEIDPWPTACRLRLAASEGGRFGPARQPGAQIRRTAPPTVPITVRSRSVRLPAQTRIPRIDFQHTTRKRFPFRRRKLLLGRGEAAKTADLPNVSPDGSHGSRLDRRRACRADFRPSRTLSFPRLLRFDRAVCAVRVSRETPGPACVGTIHHL
jgi:hypothetical protein